MTAELNMHTPIPVTLVTGFLGAGKTTLLTHILNTSTGRRFAVIENEFGDVGIDGSLVPAPSNAVFELNDGCICCTVREDLIEVFKQIMTRSNDFDHIIIETTGLAEPAPNRKIVPFSRHPTLTWHTYRFRELALIPRTCKRIFDGVRCPRIAGVARA